MRNRSVLALSSTLTLGLAACSGGGGSAGTIAGLTGPDQVSVVAADTTELTTGPATTSSGGVAPGANLFPATSDYATDQANIFIYDPSMESLDTVNSILCQTNMTAYADMVNEGPYIAQVDTALCEKGGNQDASGSGQSEGGDRGIELFTVNSRRASNGEAQVVHFWVPNDDSPFGASTIRAEMRIRGAATRQNPFGVLSLDFAMPTAGDYGDPLMYGRIETFDGTSDSIGFSFFQSEGDTSIPHNPGDFSRSSAAAVSMSSDQSTGAAKVRVAERSNFGGGDTGEVISEWKLAFNDTHVKRQLNGGTVTTLSRTNFDTKVWRYNLYHNTGANAGQRVQRNSGFGFRTANDDYGWIGYYGLWVDGGASLASGATLFKDEWGVETPEQYTLLRAPGKLIRYSKNTMDLVDLSGQTFRWWDWGADTEYLVEYATASWWKLATWDNNSNSWTDLGSPVLLDVNSDAGGWLDMWSDSLGGQVSYVDGASSITYYERELVNGSDPIFTGQTRVAFYGYFDCLKAQMNASDAEAGTIYLPDSNSVGTPYIYRFDVTDLTLYYDPDGTDTSSTAAGLAPGQEPTTGNYLWGMNSGPLVTNTAGLTNTWDLWGEDEFYTYETGHNEWNQYAAVIDSNTDMVNFDPPLQFLYTHSQQNDRNDDATYAGQKFFLEYGGAGDLHGFPYEGVDIDGDSNPDRWYPQFSLEDGVVFGPTGTEYTVRAIEMEQSLQADPGGAPGLSISDADALTLPDGSGYSTPTNGAQPTVTDPPAVIDGEVQVTE